jgi:hypothetical protein
MSQEQVSHAPLQPLQQTDEEEGKELGFCGGEGEMENSRETTTFPLGLFITDGGCLVRQATPRVELCRISDLLRPRNLGICRAMWVSKHWRF